MQAILNIAIRAARKGGSLIIRGRDRLEQQLQLETLKNLQIQAEAVMQEIIVAAYPEHSVITAHSQASETLADTVWTIEVVSGLENLLRKIPHYALVIVIEEKNKLKYTLVYDPNTEEIFTASDGGGAQCNDQRLRVTRCKQLSGAVLASSNLQAGQLKSVQRLMTFNEKGAAIYNQGCSILNLAYVAAGRIDGFWGSALSKTVINSAVLLLKETGALVSDLQGRHDYLQNGELLAANAKLFKLLLPIVVKQEFDSGTV